jgi:hypothetical protein
VSLLIFLLCSLPPLGVMAIALVHAATMRNPATLTMLALSAGIISASIVLPLTGDTKPVQNVRFTAPDGDSVASIHRTPEPVQVVRRSQTQVLYQ